MVYNFLTKNNAIAMAMMMCGDWRSFKKTKRICPKDHPSPITSRRRKTSRRTSYTSHFFSSVSPPLRAKATPRNEWMIDWLILDSWELEQTDRQTDETRIMSVLNFSDLLPVAPPSDQKRLKMNGTDLKTDCVQTDSQSVSSTMRVRCMIRRTP